MTLISKYFWRIFGLKTASNILNVMLKLKNKKSLLKWLNWDKTLGNIYLPDFIEKYTVGKICINKK